MKQFILSLCLSLFALNAWSQVTILLEEEFEDNRNAWELRISKKIAATIEEGSFQLKGKSEFSPNFFVQAIPLRKEQDFDMEMAMVHSSGAKNMGFGLTWGAKADQTDLYAFLISSNGKYTILRKERGIYSEIKPWTGSKLIEKSGKINILRIERRGDKTKYFINKKMVFQSGYILPRSQYAGILFHGTMKLEVDYFHVSLPDPSEQPARGNQ